MVDTFVENGMGVIGYLLERGTTVPKQEIDIQDVFQRFTLDSIGKIAFGVEIGSLRKDTPFSSAFDVANEATAKRMINPFTRIVSWIFPSERELKRAVKMVDEFSYGIIEQRKKDPLVETRTDILSR
jgi:cytochrome P450